MDDLELGPEAAERNRLRKVENIRKLMRDNARIFTKADADGDGKLTFSEFVDLIKLQAKLQRRAHILKGRAPAKPGDMPPMPSRAMLRDWFHMIDFDHSGELSMTEFFGFSLREALARSVQTEGLEAFLQIWDMNNDNKLDPEEFGRVTSALGFASITKDLMAMCEADEDGGVPITRLTQALHQKCEGEDADAFLQEAAAIAQRPIEALWKQVGNKPRKSSKVKGKAPTTWRGVTPKMDGATRFAIINSLNRVDLTARQSAFYDPREEEVSRMENVEPALTTLRSWLRTTGLRCLEIFQAWDISGDFNISRRELGRGLGQFGLAMAEDLVTLVFDSMCEGHHLGYDEFKEWFESTKYSAMSEEERLERAVIYIQNAIRCRQARKIVALKRSEKQNQMLEQRQKERGDGDRRGIHSRTDIVVPINADEAGAVSPHSTRFPPLPAREVNFASLPGSPRPQA